MWKHTPCLCYIYLHRYSWLYLISFIFTIVCYFNVKVLTLYLCIHLQLDVCLAASSINNPAFLNILTHTFLYPVHRFRSGIGGSSSCLFLAWLDIDILLLKVMQMHILTRGYGNFCPSTVVPIINTVKILISC